MKNQKKNIINNNMIFNDEFDFEKCKILFCMEDEKLLKYTNNQDYTDIENNNYIKKIKSSLKSLILNKTNVIKRQYNKKGCNRMYCEGNGLQYFSNNILQFILPENSCEYDMKNCNPQILLYLYKKHDLNYNHLEYYCKNRNELLNQDKLKKTDINKLLNQDHPKKQNIKWLDNLIEEVNNNKSFLFSSEYDKINIEYQKEKKKISKNFLSSMCCSIIWYYENEILEKAISKYKCIVPKYDGFLTDEDIDINDLNDISKEYDVKWDKKHFDINITETTYDNDVLDKLLYGIKNSYNFVESSFNQKHFKIIDEGLFIKKQNETQIKMLTTKQITENYKHLNYDTYNKITKIVKNDNCFIDKWIRGNKNMITYEKMDYYPDGNVPDNCYNLWTKFDVEVITDYNYVEDDLNIILNHIKILCGNNDLVYDFVIKYIAHLFYMPEQKVGKMLIFASMEGVGKGLFYKLLSNMIGKRFYSCSDPQKGVLGSFNNSLINSYVINFEELDYFSTKDSTDILKNYITETELEVNAKGKDSRMINSIHRFIGNTNHTIMPIKLSATDRRFCIIRSSDEKRGDSDYFKKLHSLVINKDLQATFYKYLSTIDIADFISEKIPETEYLNELKESFESPLLDFIKDIVNDSKTEMIYERSQKLFSDFRIFLDYNNIKICKDWSIRKFGLEMNELVTKNSDLIKRIKKSGNNYYEIDCHKVKIKFDLHDEIDNKILISDSDSD